MATSQNGWPVHRTSAGLEPLRWITGRVDPAVHSLFDEFCGRFYVEVEPIIKGHSWGWANRPIRGSSQTSNHASGTAIDLNAPAHPMGASGTFTLRQVRALRRLLKDFPELRWGGDYAGRKDEMHFEIIKKPGGSTVGMVSPAEGRVPNGGDYGPRNYAPSPWHAGLDISNEIGTPVYAPFDGTVRKVGANIAPYRSGDRNILISNPDGEGQYFGHLERARVRVGQKVKAGEHIGDMGARGNVTGPHLHLETWSNWRDPNSHFDPMILFKKYGISIGSKPKTGGGSPAPKPKPKEYFDMDKKEFEKGLDAAFTRNAEYLTNKFFAARIDVSGALAKRLGVKTMNVSTVLRHSAATLTEMREKFTQTWRRLNTQNEVLRRIANQTVSNEKELKEINDLLDERLPEPIEISAKDLED